MGPGPTNSNVDNFGVYRDFSKPYFSTTCSWTVANIICKLQLVRVKVWGKNGGPKKKFPNEKILFSATFLPLSQQHIVDILGLRQVPKRGGFISYRFRVMGGQKFSPKKF
jgi:hypothetical protein